MPDERVMRLVREWTDKDARALVRVKQIVRQGRVSHKTYTLHEIVDAIESDTNKAETQAVIG